MCSFVSISGCGCEALRHLRLASSSLCPCHTKFCLPYLSFSPDKPSEGSTAGGGSILTGQTRQSTEATCKKPLLS